MLKRAIRVGAGLLAVVFVSGCFEATTLVGVNKDGSGVIVQTMYLSAAVSQMMGGMGGEGASGGPNMDVEQAKKQAAEMGEGVEFVSVKEVTKKDGSKGTRAVYRFTDIRKVKIDPSSGPGGGDKAPTQPGQAKKQPVTFDFVKGKTSKLIVRVPQDKEEPAETAAPDDTLPDVGNIDIDEKDKKPSAQDMAMMKQMFGGMRIRMVIKVDGEITRTDATHVDKSSKTGKQQYVTLIDLNMGEIVDNEEHFAKLAAVRGDPTKAMKKLGGVPGVKWEPKERIEIEFQ